MRIHVGKRNSYAKDCLLFVGQLNQNELSLRIDHYVIAESATENIHNQLIAAIYGNLVRDLPDQGVAPWVSANEKPMVLSKPISGDAAEQRLKTEVMQLPARERRRLKEIPDVRHLFQPFFFSGVEKLLEMNHSHRLQRREPVLIELE